MVRNGTPICLRPTPDERHLLEMAAARTGKSLSSYMRYAGLKLAEQVVADSGGIEELEGWYAAIQELGARYE
jgi:uncharacterized protein (DUF1778 family)